jgi:hypothetical protein
MSSLDNFHNSNNGSRPGLAVRPAPWDGSRYGNTLLQRDAGGPAGRWDPINRAPVATAHVRRADPFDRVSLGRDVPGQEMISAHNPFQTNHGYIETAPGNVMLPGGNGESWVLYQQNAGNNWWRYLLPLK